MAVTAKRAQAIALSLAGAAAAPHFDRIAFRTPRRIFATLAADGTNLNLMFDLELQEYFCAAAPHALTPLDNGWGRQGATRCDLARVDAALLRTALQAAHARASAQAKPRATSRTRRSPKRQ